ncbi:MAG: hypothetical protein FD180_2995 [Planctomycetota bacterium]|nr:MAG: hypothetical protein FD180_2995 [Planctomycetota bacterium]
MNELPSSQHLSPTPGIRRKALADWFMETSSLVLVFLLGEPALRHFITSPDSAAKPISFWYYFVVGTFAFAAFATGMRLHRDS